MPMFKKFFYLLTVQERKSAGLLLIMIIIMAFLDTLGVASILPFMAVFTNPSIVEANYIFNFIYEFSKDSFCVKYKQEFFLFLGFFVFLLLVFSLSFKSLTI